MATQETTLKEAAQKLYKENWSLRFTGASALREHILAKVALGGYTTVVDFETQAELEELTDFLVSEGFRYEKYNGSDCSLEVDLVG